jgi:hypothetical protein
MTAPTDTLSELRALTARIRQMRMDEIESAPSAARVRQEKLRNALILMAYREGHCIRRLAGASGLSAATVNRIVSLSRKNGI